MYAYEQVIQAREVRSLLKKQLPPCSLLVRAQQARHRLIDNVVDLFLLVRFMRSYIESLQNTTEYYTFAFVNDWKPETQKELDKAR